MYAIRMPCDADEGAFRDAARRGIALALPPQDVTFVDAAEPSFPPDEMLRKPVKLDALQTALANVLAG